MPSIRLAIDHVAPKVVRALKKYTSRILLILTGIIAGIVIGSAVFAATGFSLFGGVNENPSSHGKLNNSELTALAYGILENIRDGDYIALSREIHPEYGVVFSPYATVMLSTNKCFRAEQVAVFDTDTTPYVWGISSDGGEPIEMTPADYFANFVYDRDYTAAPVIGVNHIVRSGNALENIKEVFPDAVFVDFYVPGGEKETADEPDWSSLRIGFEEYDGGLRLTVILHSKWMV